MFRKLKRKGAFGYGVRGTLKKSISELKLSAILMYVFYGFVIFCAVILLAEKQSLNETYYQASLFEEYYEQDIAFFQDQKYMEEIYNNCANRYYPYCLKEQVIRNYQYVNYKGPKSIPDLFENGGDCEAWSVFYKRMLDYAGWKTQYAITDKHVFVIGSYGNQYCVFDQERVDCTSLK